MSFPTLVGEVMAAAGGVDRFPFMAWAAGGKFEYPKEAESLFCRCQSAAEAYFLQPFTLLAGVEFSKTYAKSGELYVYPQHLAARSRIDFAVHEGSTRLALEIDGLTYHHQSGEQIEADYVRARRLIATGYTVVRFTALEAFKKTDECWEQLAAIVAARRAA